MDDDEECQDMSESFQNRFRVQLKPRAFKTGLGFNLKGDMAAGYSQKARGITFIEPCFPNKIFDGRRQRWT